MKGQKKERAPPGWGTIIIFYMLDPFGAGAFVEMNQWQMERVGSLPGMKTCVLRVLGEESHSG